MFMVVVGTSARSKMIIIIIRITLAFGRLSWVKLLLKGLHPQFYSQLHNWATVFFILRIQILNFLGKFILNRK